MESRERLRAFQILLSLPTSTALYATVRTNTAGRAGPERKHDNNKKNNVLTFERENFFKIKTEQNEK